MLEFSIREFKFMEIVVVLVLLVIDVALGGANQEFSTLVKWRFSRGNQSNYGFLECLRKVLNQFVTNHDVDFCGDSFLKRGHVSTHGLDILNVQLLEKACKECDRVLISINCHDFFSFRGEDEASVAHTTA